MKWVLSHQSTDNHKWLLQDAPEPAQFTYNLQNQSMRIKSRSNRLFFLEVSGFFHKKLLLRSEYGVVIGESQWTQTITEGSLLMNEYKYLFSLQNNQLSLYDKNKSLLSTVSIDHVNSLEKTEQFALVFSLAWIVSSNITTKKTLQVA